MEPVWKDSWMEVWSAGDGRSRTYCGIARTEEGFAVDLFQGDSCVASSTFASQREALIAAHRLRDLYAPSPVDVARHETLRPAMMSSPGSARA